MQISTFKTEEKPRESLLGNSVVCDENDSHRRKETHILKTYQKLSFSLYVSVYICMFMRPVLLFRFNVPETSYTTMRLFVSGKQKSYLWHLIITSCNGANILSVCRFTAQSVPIQQLENWFRNSFLYGPTNRSPKITQLCNI